MYDLLNAKTDVVMRARTALHAHAPKFDLCIIDTPPERNSLLVGALAVADFVVTPMTLGLYEQGGVAKLFDTIQGTRSALRHISILLMKTNGRSSKEREMVKHMRSQFGDYVLPAELPEFITLRVTNAFPLARLSSSAPHLTGRRTQGNGGQSSPGWATWARSRIRSSSTKPWRISSRATDASGEKASFRFFPSGTSASCLPSSSSARR
ncbi:ParA family protein [Variovorax paradoxus]|nr:ParA family protein [Variovorax paradoxus]